MPNTQSSQTKDSKDDRPTEANPDWESDEFWRMFVRYAQAFLRAFGLTRDEANGLIGNYYLYCFERIKNPGKKQKKINHPNGYIYRTLYFFALRFVKSRDGRGEVELKEEFLNSDQDQLMFILGSREHVHAILPEAMRVLNERERTVIEYRFGSSHLTLMETGELMGISHTMVKKLQDRATSKLREEIRRLLLEQGFDLD